MLVLSGPRDRPQPFVAEMSRRGVPVHVMRMAGDFDPTLPLRLSRFIREGGFSWVHTHLFHADLYGTLAARLSGVSHILSTRHGLDPWRKDAHWAWLDRTAATFQTRIIVVSGALSRWLVEFERLPTDKLQVIPLGIDSHAFRAGPVADLPAWSRPVIGSVSRLIPQKGVDVLLRAFAEFRRRNRSASLVIVGDGPSRGSLENEAAALGVREAVHFLGFRSDIAALMSRFDVFAFPSLGEGFGLVLLEAMACARPIVATHALAVPEIVRADETGLLVPPGDASSLTAALDVLAASPDLRRRLGEEGRRHVEAMFTLEAMVNETARVYDELLADEPVRWAEPGVWRRAS